MKFISNFSSLFVLLLLAEKTQARLRGASTLTRIADDEDRHLVKESNMRIKRPATTQTSSSNIQITQRVRCVPAAQSGAHMCAPKKQQHNRNLEKLSLQARAALDFLDVMETGAKLVDDLGPREHDADANHVNACVPCEPTDTAVYTYIVTTEDGPIVQPKLTHVLGKHQGSLLGFYTPEYHGGDDNHDGILQAGETWLYASHMPLEPVHRRLKGQVERYVWGHSTAVDAAAQTVMDSDKACLTLPPTPPVEEDLCHFHDCSTIPDELIFKWSYGEQNTSGQKQQGDDDNDDNESDVAVINRKPLGNKAYVVYSDQEASSGNLGSRVYYEGTVGSNGRYIIGEASDDEPFTATTYVSAWPSKAVFQRGEPAYQVMRYDTSCSQPIILGSVLGSIRLVGYQSLRCYFVPFMR